MSEPTNNQLMPEETPERLTLDSNELINVCKHLYRRCASDKGVDAKEISTITMKDFVTWCNEHNEPATSGDDLATRLNLNPQAIRAITQIFQGCPWQCAAVLYPVWFVIVLSHRMPIENSLRFVHTAITMGFRDGKIAQMQGVQEMKEGVVNTDGFLLAMIQEQQSTMVQQLADIGFDRLYREWAQVPAERPEDIVQKPFPPHHGGRIGW